MVQDGATIAFGVSLLSVLSEIRESISVQLFTCIDVMINKFKTRSLLRIEKSGLKIELQLFILLHSSVGSKSPASLVPPSSHAFLT